MPRSRRHAALLRTAACQRLARRYDDISAGRYRPSASPGDAKALGAEVARAEERRARLVAGLEALAESAPQLAGGVARVLAHERAAAAACFTAAGAAAAAPAVVKQWSRPRSGVGGG